MAKWCLVLLWNPMPALSHPSDVLGAVPNLTTSHSSADSPPMPSAPLPSSPPRIVTPAAAARRARPGLAPELPVPPPPPPPPDSPLLAPPPPRPRPVPEPEPDPDPAPATAAPAPGPPPRCVSGGREPPVGFLLSPVDESVLAPPGATLSRSSAELMARVLSDTPAGGATAVLSWPTFRSS